MYECTHNALLFALQLLGGLDWPLREAVRILRLATQGGSGMFRWPLREVLRMHGLVIQGMLRLATQGGSEAIQTGHLGRQ